MSLQYLHFRQQVEELFDDYAEDFEASLHGLGYDVPRLMLGELEAVCGSSDFSHTYNGATWHFASATNRDTFAANPARYAPQYGGYCAYAVSEGYTTSTTPKAWKIVDVKLYLNYSKRVQRRWEKDIPTRITNANANWPKVLE